MPIEEYDKQYVQSIVKYEPILKAYARSLLPTWEGVEEVLQDSYLIIWRKWDQLQDASEFLPWAKTILRFEALKYRRNKARDRHVLTEETLEIIAKDDDLDMDVYEEKKKALEQCLQKLKSSHRQIVLSHYHDGQPLFELADKLGKSSNSLYKLMSRLRVKLQDCVQSNYSYS